MLVRGLVMPLVVLQGDWARGLENWGRVMSLGEWVAPWVVWVRELVDW